MEPLIQHEGKVVSLNRVNVDTDQIIPKQFLKRIERSGFGQFLFNDWRYTSSGESDPNFELNHPSAQGASILLAGPNFGCGSSREHAVWAIRDYGFRVILAPSYADIFYNNCFKNGVLPIVISDATSKTLESYRTGECKQMKIDLPHQTIELFDGTKLSFDMDAHRKTILVEGLDDIGITMKYIDVIEKYESSRSPYQLVYSV